MSLIWSSWNVSLISTFLKNPVFWRFAIKLATASALSAVPSRLRLDGIVHLAQPHCFGFVDRLAQHHQQVDWPAPPPAIDRSRPPAAFIVVGLRLPLEVSRLHVAEFADLSARQPAFAGRLRFALPVQRLPSR